MRRVFLAALLAAGSAPWAAAESLPLPPPPEAPPWFDPIPLRVRTALLVDGSDSGPPPATPIKMTRHWNPNGTLTVEGWMQHGGSDRIDASKTAAWLQGDRVVIAYRYMETSFPGEPICLCLGFSKVRLVVTGLKRNPAGVDLYMGSLEFRKQPVANAD